MDYEGATWELFFETYRRTYPLIREVYPEGRIAATGISWMIDAKRAAEDREHANEDLSAIPQWKEHMTKFITMARQAGMMPDIINWHFPRERIDAQLQFLRAFAPEVKSVMFMEYVHRAFAPGPSGTIWSINNLEKANARDVNNPLTLTFAWTNPYDGYVLVIE